jgi:hypothetical protein
VLHRIGVCLHYQQSDLLQQYVILKNEWATAAVYQVLEDPTVAEQKKGFFNRTDLQRIWSDDRYQDMQPQLLALMQEFGLAYPLPNQKDFITPPLLPNTPPSDWAFPEADAIEIRVEYAFMPKALITHIQVPQSQFEIQAERLLRYHVTDVRTFYSGDDVWSVPLEIYGSTNTPVRPYHVTLQLPGETKPEFVLLLPFSPLKRPNMVGWLAARNDPPHYGELFLVRFPQQRLLLGPQQISALIEQDPAISYQFGLWNREGSRLVRGNLLVLPVGQGLLYVEPIYLQSTSNALPTLVRVVVTDGRRFVMERNLQDALRKLVAG